jgi:hypothetical protein
MKKRAWMPFFASVMTYTDASGLERRRLSISYTAGASSPFLLCHLFPHQADASLVFALGDRSIARPMDVSCPGATGSLGLADNASFGIVEDADPALWNELFPARPDGSRWFALRIAARNEWGQWDSRFGQDYRLLLAPR